MLINFCLFFSGLSCTVGVSGKHSEGQEKIVFRSLQCGNTIYTSKIANLNPAETLRVFQNWNRGAGVWGAGLTPMLAEGLEKLVRGKNIGFGISHSQMLLDVGLYFIFLICKVGIQ